MFTSVEKRWFVFLADSNVYVCHAREVKINFVITVVVVAGHGAEQWAGSALLCPLRIHSPPPMGLLPSSSCHGAPAFLTSNTAKSQPPATKSFRRWTLVPTTRSCRRCPRRAAQHLVAAGSTVVASHRGERRPTSVLLGRSYLVDFVITISCGWFLLYSFRSYIYANCYSADYVSHF